MRFFLFTLLLLGLLAAPVSASDWADATPTAWHQLARAESLLSAPEPPNPVAVCVVDSGVNLTPDLAPAVIERLAYDGGDPGDTYPQEGIDDGHGTYVATFLAGQVNGWGGAGLWPRAKIVSVRVFPPGGKRATAAAYLRGLSECVQVPAVRVINLSLGDIDGSPREIDELRDRIRDYRVRRDYNIVAAAGNRGGQLEMPASFPEALAVGAADKAGDLCSFSARGEGLDIVAPGCDLVQADQRGNVATFAGTSFAAPIVSAAIAAYRTYSGAGAADAERELVASARASGAGPMLDVQNLMRSFDWSRRAPEPIEDNGTDRQKQSVSPDFVVYPRPQVRLRHFRRARRTQIRIFNRPRDTSVELRIGTRTTHRSRSRFWLPRGSARVRFIGDLGISPWLTIAKRARYRDWLQDSR